MSYIAHEEEYKGYHIKIEYDEDAANPRKEWDNAGTMVCWHRRYILGDEQPKESPQDYLNGLAEEYGVIRDDDDNVDQEVVALLLAKHYVILPLYLMDHSSISMSTGSFNDPWDSGQVGFIYMGMIKAHKEWGAADVDDGLVITQAKRCLEQEVEIYDQYLRGDVYGYVIEEDNCDESCWGFFGLDYCIQQAREVVDYSITRNAEKAAEHLLESMRSSARSTNLCGGCL